MRNYAGKGPELAAERSPVIAALNRAFEEEFSDQEQTWPDVLAQLNAAIGPVRVQPVNASTGAKSLDYRIVDGDQGVRVIAVGGNSPLPRTHPRRAFCQLLPSQLPAPTIPCCRWVGGSAIEAVTRTFVASGSPLRQKGGIDT